MLPMRPLHRILNLTRQHRLLYSITAVTGVSSALIASRLYTSQNIPKSLRSPSSPRPYSNMPPPKSYKTIPYTPAPNLMSTPPNPKDFSRQDETQDTDFYTSPRFVTHIDDNAIESLACYYSSVLPSGTAVDASSKTTPPRILDLCSSWISHYPATVTEAARRKEVQVYGLGMNARELERNKVLDSGGRVLRDLNAHPHLDAQTLSLASASKDLIEDEKLDATTCTVSIDYLTQPTRVLSAVRALTKTGGTVHLAISNRCFPTKAVRRWLYADEEKRLEMCAEDLWRAGWRDVEIVVVTDGSRPGEEEGQVDGSSDGRRDLKAFMAMMGLSGGRGDPLWVVRGRNHGDEGLEGERGSSKV